LQKPQRRLIRPLVQTWSRRQESNLRPPDYKAVLDIFAFRRESWILLILLLLVRGDLWLSIAQFGPVWRKWHTSGTQKSGYTCS